MAGIMKPDLGTTALAIRTRLRALLSEGGKILIPAQVAHDRHRLVMLRGQLDRISWDFAKRKIHYWEATQVSGAEEEIAARFLVLDRRQWSIRGIYGYSDSDEDAENSTFQWRRIREKVQDGLRADPAIFGPPGTLGVPYNTPRTVNLLVNGLQSVAEKAVVHFCEFRLLQESETELDC